MQPVDRYLNTARISGSVRVTIHIKRMNPRRRERRPPATLRTKTGCTNCKSEFPRYRRQSNHCLILLMLRGGQAGHDDENVTSVILPAWHARKGSSNARGHSQALKQGSRTPYILAPKDTSVLSSFTLQLQLRQRPVPWHGHQGTLASYLLARLTGLQRSTRSFWITMHRSCVRSCFVTMPTRSFEGIS